MTGDRRGITRIFGGRWSTVQSNAAPKINTERLGGRWSTG